MNYLDPVRLVGEGRYNLHSLQEISVTNSFLGLDKVTRNCQTIESLDDCKTRLYLETMRENCKCLPLSMNLFGKVQFLENFIQTKDKTRSNHYPLHNRMLCV